MHLSIGLTGYIRLLDYWTNRLRNYRSKGRMD